MVYEAERCGANQHFALKILNPVGYKLERKATLKQVCIVGLGRSCRSGCSVTSLFLSSKD